ncbi:transforming acidic coiled-coil-containing protein 3-like isoform X1 [Lytechinus variegatus]|uniref:transforming acidic coiled-coil-containing protein 3-like isoform X1 n=1 Tax=Lytechinus variegatus TaxID=7654 RepID=UPI001BB25676|nr:transforming acidic coiled-coil-containing protein 3-like isoform X1 [Lytechinus variegatus]
MGDTASHMSDFSSDGSLSPSSHFYSRSYTPVQSLPYTTEVNINFNHLSSSTQTRDSIARRPPQRSNSMPVTRGESRRPRVQSRHNKDGGSVMNVPSPKGSPASDRTLGDQKRGENSRKSATRERIRGSGNGSGPRRTCRLMSANAALDMGSAHSDSHGVGDSSSNTSSVMAPACADVYLLSDTQPEIEPCSLPDVIDPADLGTVEMDPGVSDDELMARLRQRDVKKVLEALGVPDDSIADDYKDLSSGSDSLFTDAELSQLDNDHDLKSLEEELGGDLDNDVCRPDGHRSPTPNRMVNGIGQCEYGDSSELSKDSVRSPSHSSSDSALGVAFDNAASSPPQDRDSPMAQVSFQTPAQGQGHQTNSPYGAVRELDEKERWSERATIVTKQDHEDYMIIAAEIINDIILNLPVGEVSTVPDPETPVVSSPEVNQPDQDSAPSTKDQSPPRESNEEAPPIEGGVTMEDDVSAPAPPEPASKNIYQLSEEDIANMNPFQSTNKMQNSPPITKKPMADNQYSADFDNIKDPFGTSSKVANTPETVTRSPKKKSPKTKSPTREPEADPMPPATNDVGDDAEKDGHSPPSPKDILLQSPQMNGAADLDEEDDSRHEYNGVQLLSTGDGDSGVASAEERQPDEVMPSFDAQGGIPDVIGDDEFRPADEASEEGGGGGGHGGLTRDMSFEEMEFRLAEEVFANSDAMQFDVDYLAQAGSSDNFKDSALARQSLYVKFDPLVKGCPTPQGPSALPVLEPEGGDLLQMKTPSPGQVLDGRAKRRAAANQRASTSPDNTAASKNVDSLLAFSPNNDLDAEDAVDSANSSTDIPPSVPQAVTSSDEGIVQLLRYSQSDMDAAVLQAARSATVEAQRVAEEKYKEYEKKSQASNEKIKEITKAKETLEKSSADMRALIIEYEKSIQQLMADVSQAKSSSDDTASQLQKEKDQALEDLASVESAFSDLHRRYEKLKQTLDGYRKNEETLKKHVTEYQAKVKKQEQRYQTLKSHAEEKIEKANEQIAKVTKSYQSEIAGLQASLKREQMNVEGLEKNIQQKTKQVGELTNICDELISKMGSSSQ